MMFSSKTPRDLNNDPKPWDDNRGERYAMPQDCGREAAEVKFSPRPEFDHVQHNEPNRVLVAFRHCPVEHRGAFIKGLHADPETTWTADYVEHARKVLSRLARLER